MQGLYQWLVAGGEAGDIQAQLTADPAYAKADAELFATLLSGAIGEARDLEQILVTALDRPLGRLSPVEHGILLVATYELRHFAEIPYRVVISEAIEIAKRFGGTDGHKYVNGVLDRLARALRPAEAERARTRSDALR